jgi:AraC-like DNA-binding protein
MNTTIEKNNFDFTINDETALKQNYTGSEFIEEEITLPSPYGASNLRQWKFDGIKMGFIRHDFKDYFSFKKENKCAVVNLEFNLKGNYLIRHLGKEYNVKSGQHNIVYTPGFSNTFLNKDLEGETFYIQFNPDLFLRITENSNSTIKNFSDKIIRGEPAVIGSNSLSINIGLQRAINDVRNCRYNGGLKKLFMLSKSIEILVLQAEAYHLAESKINYYCDDNFDKDKIYFARDYIMENINNPPNLSELSRIAGINEYKLKRGFKETFNTTVFGYLSERRLELSRQALLENKKTVSEIAYEFGYSSPQHFSNAFKKKFGLSPKYVKK